MDNTIGKHIQEARLRNGMSQLDLSIRCGVAIQTINRWEGGKRSPRANDLVVLARVLGVSSDALLGLDPAFTVRERSNVERIRMVTR